MAAPFVTRISLTARLSVSVRPKSPWTRPLMYSQYWVRIGRSRPAAAFRSAISSGPSRPPRAAEIGSPMTRMRTNTIVTRIHSIGMMRASRTKR